MVNIADMRRNSTAVRTLTASLAVVLLLTQWATVAFACAAPGTVETSPPALMADIGADMDGMPDCARMNAVVEPPAADSSLCHAHCGQGSQASASTFGLDQPASAVGLPGFWAPALWPDNRLAISSRQVPRPKPASGWPPPYLSFLVLRN